MRVGSKYLKPGLNPARYHSYTIILVIQKKGHTIIINISLSYALAQQHIPRKDSPLNKNPQSRFLFFQLFSLPKLHMLLFARKPSKKKTPLFNELYSIFFEKAELYSSILIFMYNIYLCTHQTLPITSQQTNHKHMNTLPSNPLNPSKHALMIFQHRWHNSLKINKK